VAVKPLSYTNFKGIGLTPQQLPRPDPGLARAYVDVDGNGQHLFFTAPVLYTFDQTPETATPSEFSFWRRQQDGTYVKDGSLLPEGSAGCLHPRKAIVADFNGDGRQDVFVACHGWDQPPFPGERNSVVLSRANGTYVIQSANPATGFFHSATAADFNGDGHADVLATDNFATPSVRAFLNKGDGSFTLDATFRLPTVARSRRSYFTIEALDVNEDGHADLFLGGHEFENAATLVLLNPGNGDFGKATVSVVPAVPNEGVVLDVVATGSGANRALWVARSSGGDGTFYQSRVVQKLTWPALTSTVPELRRPAPWTPWLIPTTLNGTQVIASDDASVDLALPY
jgi:hypothetical protein